MLLSFCIFAHIFLICPLLWTIVPFFPPKTRTILALIFIHVCLVEKYSFTVEKLCYALPLHQSEFSSIYIKR